MTRLYDSILKCIFAKRILLFWRKFHWKYYLERSWQVSVGLSNKGWAANRGRLNIKMSSYQSDDRLIFIMGISLPGQTFILDKTVWKPYNLCNGNRYTRKTFPCLETGSRALFQYPIRRLIVRSREVSKPQDSYLQLYDRSKKLLPKCLSNF